MSGSDPPQHPLLAQRSAEFQERRASVLGYRELFEANPQPMWVYDLETLSFLAVNDRAVAHYGYSRDEFLAMKITDIRPPGEVPRLMQRIAQVRVEDIRDAGLWQHRRKDGSLIDVEISSHTLDFGGRHAQIVLANDVTARLQAERMLRESEARFRALTELSSDWYWEQDDHLRFTHMSKPNAGRQDMDLDTFLGRTLREAPDVGWEEPQLAALEAIVEAKQPFRDFEIGRTYCNGPKRYMQLSGEPVFEASGRFAGYRGIGKDITDRRRAENALASSEDKFRRAFNVNPDSININRLEDGLFVSINRGFTQMTGYTEDEVIGRTSADLDIWDNLEDRARLVEGLRNDGMVADLEARFRAKNGDVIYGSMSAALIEIENIPHLINVTHDITKRRQREEDLRRFRAAMDATEDAIYLVDRASMRFVDVNAGACNMVGLAREQILALGPAGLLSMPHEELARIYDSIIAGGGPAAPVEMLRSRGEGKQAWIEIRRSAQRSGDGWMIVTVARDITLRKRAKDALRQSETRFRSLTEMSSDYYWETDSEHRLIQRSEGQGDSALSVLAHGSPIGKRRWEIPYLSPDEAGWKTHRSMLDAHLPFRNFEISRRGIDGKEHAYSIGGDPQFDASGAFHGYRGVGTSITERKRHEEELQRLNEELERRVVERTHALEAANNELEAFSYSVSHDLRAPLRAIRGFSRLVETEYARKLDEQGKDYLRRVSAGAEKMGMLIDDLLKLTRISRQAMKTEPVDLSALARELASELQLEAPERKVEWLISPQVKAEGDPGLLRVVLQNLLGNAWKYSSRRELAPIEFGVGEKDGRAAFFVRDNGAGYDMAHAQKLFGAFQRLHSATEFPGSGIGLATVARILRRHGGEAWAEAYVGKGATFYFSLG